jgi:hypothetical protein
MAELLTKYTDTKNVIHDVKHVTLPTEDNSEKEQILEELYRALTKKDSAKSA